MIRKEIKEKLGVPWRIRTSDLLLRRQLLYPAELRAQTDFASIMFCLLLVNKKPLLLQFQFLRLILGDN
jgi:hypothetical protein